MVDFPVTSASKEVRGQAELLEALGPFGALGDPDLAQERVAITPAERADPAVARVHLLGRELRLSTDFPLHYARVRAKRTAPAAFGDLALTAPAQRTAAFAARELFRVDPTADLLARRASGARGVFDVEVLAIFGHLGLLPSGWALGQLLATLAG